MSERNFMHRSNRRSKTCCRKKLRIESLERRELLAADFLFNLDAVGSLKSSDPLSEVIGNELAGIFRSATQSTNSYDGFLASLDPALIISAAGDITVDVVVDNSVEEAKPGLMNAGFTPTAEYGKIISGTISLTKLNSLAQIDEINFVKPTYRPSTNVGSVTSQANEATRADVAKATFDVDGSGIKIGVLSDSYDFLGGAASGVASGDLPGAGNPNGYATPVEVLADDGTSDEGRAMLELIHDIAPGASLSFHTAFVGPADFAQGILDLANAGADVIVDDVTYFDQPFFQDGIIAQAAEAVASAGIPFFSSAGNQGRQSYESVFRPVANGTADYTFHDFDPGAGQDLRQDFTLAPGERVNFIVQWDQPFASTGGAGSANDVDAFLYRNGVQVGISNDINNGGDAIERITYQNTSSTTENMQLAIAYYTPGGGPVPGYLKYIDFEGGSSDTIEYATNSSTLYGHHNIANGAGVGAAFYQNTPAFGVSPPIPESTTSAGGVPIFFNTVGNRLSSPDIRQQPRFTAPDGTNTTFFIPGIDPEGDGFENFFGTSAAAPNAAAVAALMLEAAGGPGSLTPSEVFSALEQTAIDMGPSGFDFDTGHGLIDAQAAIASIVSTASPFAADAYFTATVGGTQNELFVTDGSATGTRLVKNLAGNASSNPTELTILGNNLIFAANTANGQRELYFSRGTSSTTTLITNLSGSTSSKPENLTRAGNVVYFTALREDGQRELFRTQGTSASTRQLINLSGTRSSNPQGLTAVGAKLFFTAAGSDNQRELYVSDGTLAGTKLVRDLSGTTSSRPSELTALGNKLFFTAILPNGNRELLVTDGTGLGTQIVRNLFGSVSSVPRDLTVVGSRLFFTALLPSGHRELFVTDGTSAGTKLLNVSGNLNSAPRNLTAVNNRLFFTARIPGNQLELHVSNGDTVNLVRDLAGTQNSNPTQLVQYRGLLYFTARLSSGQRELLESNGTSAGTRLVANLSGAVSSGPSNLTRVEDGLLFSAIDETGQRELFRTDATAEGTQLIRNINGTLSSNPRQFTRSFGTTASTNSLAQFASVTTLSDDVAPELSEPANVSSPIEFGDLDVNGDGKITALDVLNVVNMLSSVDQPASGESAASNSLRMNDNHEIGDFFEDVSRDGVVSAFDVLQIINHISRSGRVSQSTDQASLIWPLQTNGSSDLDEIETSLSLAGEISTDAVDELMSFDNSPYFATSFAENDAFSKSEYESIEDELSSIQPLSELTAIS